MIIRTISALPLRRCRLKVLPNSPLRGFSTSPHMRAGWGFIGLGRMGYAMANNLRARIPAEDTLFVHDINKSATDQFLAEHIQGVRVSKDVRSVAEQAEIVITCLPEPQHVVGVYRQMLDPHQASGGRTSTSPPGRLFIDTSTIDPTTSASVAASVTSAGRDLFVDAPMSGGVVGAQAGTLTFMIGAAPELVARASEVLLKMGKRVLHLGEQGAGLKGKLANNYLLALNNIATAEAMHMGIQWGLDPKALAGMINTSTGRCWPSEVNNPVPGVIEGSPASRGYEGGFGVALASKDLKLALKAADEAGVRLALGQAAREVYDRTEEAEDCRGRDFSVVYRYLGGRE